jgi:hypothetical protein
MPDTRVEIQQFQYSNFLRNIEFAIEDCIFRNEHEYNELGVTFAGLTPRIRVNLRESITTEFRVLLGDNYPRVQSRLAEELIQILDASLIGLFSTQGRDTIVQFTVRQFLNTVISSLLNMDKYPSFLGGYIKIQGDELIIEQMDDD